jgi:hypothetical protein
MPPPVIRGKFLAVVIFSCLLHCRRVEKHMAHVFKAESSLGSDGLTEHGRLGPDGATDSDLAQEFSWQPEAVGMRPAAAVKPGSAASSAEERLLEGSPGAERVGKLVAAAAAAAAVAAAAEGQQQQQQQPQDDDAADGGEPAATLADDDGSGPEDVTEHSSQQQQQQHMLVQSAKRARESPQQEGEAQQQEQAKRCCTEHLFKPLEQQQQQQQQGLVEVAPPGNDVLLDGAEMADDVQDLLNALVSSTAGPHGAAEGAAAKLNNHEAAAAATAAATAAAAAASQIAASAAAAIASANAAVAAGSPPAAAAAAPGAPVAAAVLQQLSCSPEGSVATALTAAVPAAAAAAALTAEGDLDRCGVSFVLPAAGLQQQQQQQPGGPKPQGWSGHALLSKPTDDLDEEAAGKLIEQLLPQLFEEADCGAAEVLHLFQQQEQEAAVAAAGKLLGYDAVVRQGSELSAATRLQSMQWLPGRQCSTSSSAWSAAAVAIQEAQVRRGRWL